MTNLSAFLREQQHELKGHEHVARQIWLKLKNNITELYFPHMYIYEMYNNTIKFDVEKTIQSDIKYIVNNKSILTKEIQKNLCKRRKNNYIFDNFIPGKKNRLPYNICIDIAHKNEIKYNPLIIYGDESTGKTHLANSIFNRLISKKIYLGDGFDILGKSLNHDLFTDFISYDVIIIENIHEISDNKQASIFLEKIIDHFVENNKQIIMTCRGENSVFNNLSCGLRHRLESGLSLKLKKADLDVRIRFIKKFCAESRIKLNNDTVLLISRSLDNIRTIKGLLLKLFAIISEKGNITFQDINEALNQNSFSTSVSFQEILESTAEHLGVKTEDIMGMNRGRHISRARQICMYICKKKLNWSYPRIGQKFGGRDHSTVIYNIKKIQQLKRVDQEIDKILSELFQKFSNGPEIKY